MRYVRRITLENFQSHKHTEMEFGPELNVIVGPSDSGKSAIIRALKWVMYNEPSGDFFIREGEKECKVTLELSDGTSLQRYRTRSKNGYRLVDNVGNENIFEGIGLSVPQEIMDITGIRKIKLDADSENSINLGEQLEGAFLLTEKASTRANAIGRLVGVDIVDDALREVLKDMRSLNQSRKQKEETLQITNKKLLEFEYIEELKATQVKLASIMETIHGLNKRIEKLELINKKLHGLTSEISKNEFILKGFGKLGDFGLVLSKAESKIDLLNSYNRLSANYKGINISKERTNYTLDNVTKFVEGSPPFSVMELKVYRLLNLKRIFAITEGTKLEMERTRIISNSLDRLDYTINLINSTDMKSKKLKDLHTLGDKRASILNSERKGVIYIKKLNAFLDNEYISKKLEEKSSYLNILISYKERYDSIKNEILGTEVKIAKNNDILANVLNEYKKLLQSIEKCPYCLNDIDEHTIEHIITHHLGG